MNEEINGEAPDTPSLGIAAVPSQQGASWMLATQEGSLLVQLATVDADGFTPTFLAELKDFMRRHNVLSLSSSWLGRHR